MPLFLPLMKIVICNFIGDIYVIYVRQHLLQGEHIARVEMPADLHLALAAAGHDLLAQHARQFYRSDVEKALNPTRWL